MEPPPVMNNDATPFKTVLLSCNFKDEENILDWVVYHLTLGFNWIVLWDDHSSRDFMLPCLPQEWPVERHRVHAIKQQYMAWSLRIAQERKIDYCLHLDADEYLFVSSTYQFSISTYVTSLPFPTILLLPWVFFGSNFREDQPKNEVWLPFLFPRSARHVSPYIKTMAPVEKTKGIRDPHTYFYSESLLGRKKGMTVQSSRRQDRMTDKNKEEEKKEVLYAHLASQLVDRHHPERYLIEDYDVWIGHYHQQSWKQYCRRRGRPRDDTGRRYETEYTLLDDNNQTPAPVSFHAKWNDITNSNIISYLLSPLFETRLRNLFSSSPGVFTTTFIPSTESTKTESVLPTS